MLREAYREASGFGMQVFLSFCFGILFSPWTNSLLLTILFFIVYEVVIYLLSVSYSLLDRAVIMAAYFFGFAFGRVLAEQPIVVY